MKYWRSLEQRAGTEEARSFLEREFPEGASELPEGIPRRTMLSLIGASLSLAGLTACRRPVEAIVPYVDPPEEVIPGIPRTYATTMPFRNEAYGLLVESHEGRPTKIEGNPLHPATRGASSAWMQAAILQLYDPDRAQSVRQKTEPKTWADFVNAWKAIEQTEMAAQGSGLAVLSGSYASPTLARLAEAFRTRFSMARWVVWEPVGDESVLHGVRAATGQALRPVLHLERAKVILTLDADILLTEGEAVVHARGFADGRRVRSEQDGMNRLYAVESLWSSTGANADHRLALPSGQIPAFCATLAAEMGVAQPGAAELRAGTTTTGPSGGRAAWVRALARDLVAHRGAGLVVAGWRQPPHVHAAVLAINAALGNVGTTVTYRAIQDAGVPATADLGDLVQAMAGGAVKTLLVLGGNPVYDTPADLGFAKALAKVEQVVHLSQDAGETAAAAGWHLPEAHFLEAWGDCRSADGTLSVVQPLILPLYGGKSAIELAGLIATGEDRPGYDLVRETWAVLLGEAEGEARWRRVLHDGLLEGSALPPVVPAVEPGGTATPGAAIGSGAQQGGLELVFQVSPAVFDGRFSNLGWLQELPDPITKITWDNAALVSPATARALEAGNEDVVRISCRGRDLELPLWIVPGQADGTIGVALGYGRRIAGRIGSGVGADAYALRTSSALWVEGVRVERTGRSHPIAQTQDHGTMEGRPMAREATLAEYRREPNFANEAVEVPPLVQLYEPYDYGKGFQWGMAIDLNACTGCNACVIACQSENNIPVVGKAQVRKGREMHWIRVDRYFSGVHEAEEHPSVFFQPVPCMHCENAPCEQVCPVAATVHDREGINAMVYNRCIGTRYCSNNCPYKVRRFNFFNFTKDTPEVLTLAQNPDVTVRSRGVMEKCTYCIQRIQAARIDSKLSERPIEDGDIQTACQQACPAQAITFGNVIDAGSRVSAAKRQNRNYAMLADLNTRPRTTYLARLRNPNAELEALG